VLRKLSVVMGAAAVLLAAGGAAVADDTTGGASTYGAGNTWIVQVRGHVLFSGDYNPGGGNAGSSANFTPPPCWYEPAFDPAGAKKYLEVDTLPISDSGQSIGYDFGQKVKGELQDVSGGNQQYHAGENGYWYEHVCGSDVPGEQQQAILNPAADFVWVPAGTAPPGPAFTGRMLAEMARSVMVIGHVPIDSSPRAGVSATVQLPTWLWAGAARDFVVIATLPGGGLSATVTAHLADIQISSVPAEATMHPGGGDCGGRGVAFNGSTGAPPCGVTFGRSAASAQIGLQLIWHITWTSTDGDGGDMGTVPIAQALNFRVQEVQVVGAGN
jgi:enoyl reductase